MHEIKLGVINPMCYEDSFGFNDIHRLMYLNLSICLSLFC